MKNKVFESILILLLFYFLINSQTAQGIPLTEIEFDRICYDELCKENHTVWNPSNLECIYYTKINPYNPSNVQYLIKENLEYVYDRFNISNIEKINEEYISSKLWYHFTLKNRQENNSETIRVLEELRSLNSICNDFNLTNKQCEELSKISFYIWDKDLIDSDIPMDAKVKIGEMYSQCITDSTSYDEPNTILPYLDHIEIFVVVIFIVIFLIIVTIIFIIHQNRVKKLNRGKKNDKTQHIPDHRKRWFSHGQIYISENISAFIQK